MRKWIFIGLLTGVFLQAANAETAGLGALKLCGNLKLSAVQISELTTQLTVLSATAVLKKKEIIALSKEFKVKISDERSTMVDVAAISARKLQLKTSLMTDMDHFWTNWYFEILDQDQRAPAYNCSRFVEQVMQALI